MTITVLPNVDKNGCLETLENIGKFFRENGIKGYLPQTVCCSNFESLPEEELFQKGDFIVTIGGDGTIIRYAKKAAQAKKPIIGINAGRVGYLANIEQGEYKLLSKLKTGEYTTEKRMMLDITVSDENGNVSIYKALNDAVITSGYISRIVDIYAGIENDSIHYRADGIIISTPTGSTAYSLSAGGPIIDSSAQCICITPICSHSLSAKPIILGSDRVIKVNAFSKKRADIYLTVDGRKVAQVRPKTKITIAKSDEYVELIRLNDKNFYSTLSMKFSEFSK
ncbi:MAG TPA: NAD+ kinase [Ruminococcaceae bacterium]|nr:NAD+ kinase [Oscillospiraceae bacterium]